MRIKADVDRCIGAGQCVTAARSVFAQNEDDGMVIVLNETPVDGDVASARSAIRLCPARAIWEESDPAQPAS
jgi:ferredoxin